MQTDKNQDTKYLRDEQYKDASNLSARARLHILYSSNPVGWHEWMFAQLNLQPGIRVLECGCGPGWLWRENLDHVPANCQLTLTDLSPGMVAESKVALAQSDIDFRFREANITELPFPDECFDVVVANHMLYHVAERPKALAEVRRVLGRNGRFFAATNGQTHLRELRELNQKFMPDNPEAAAFFDIPFSLGNGRSQLESVFSAVELKLYPDSLLITEVQPVLDYIRSSSATWAVLSEEQIAQISDYVKSEIDEKGAFHITKSVGLFVASGTA